MRTDTRGLLSVLLAGTLCLTGLLGCSGSSAEEIPTSQATRGTFDVSLTLTGELKAVNSLKIVAPRTSTGLKIVTLAEDGSMVEEGDILVAFDTADLDRDLAQTRLSLEVKQDGFEVKRLEVRNREQELRDAVTRAEIALERHRLEQTDSVTVSAIERERTRLDIQVAEMDLAKAIATEEGERLRGQAELSVMELELQRLQDDIERLEEDRTKMEVRASSGGIVIVGRTWRSGQLAEGDEVWAGQKIIELPDLSEMRIETWIHEVDVSQVALGQTASFTLDSAPDDSHAAEVEHVANLATTRSQESRVKYFKSRLSVRETTETMRPGMTAKVELQIDHLEDVVSVPREAVFERGDERIVYRARAGGFTAEVVSLGPTNATHVVVEQGLEAGATVALLDPAAASPGSRR